MKMDRISRWGIAIILIIFAVLLFNKGLDLWSLGTNVDGDGIGVHFLAFEINDKVPEESIPSYAMGFFISSLVISVLSVVIIGMNLNLKLKTSWRS
jgi:hypothetical protein